MKSKLVIVSLAMFLCFSFSCKEKEKTSPCSVAWATELQSQINAITTAAQAYGANPTVANCNAYKNAAQAYVNALTPYGNCATLTVQQKSSWQTALNQAQQSVNGINCTPAK